MLYLREEKRETNWMEQETASLRIIIRSFHVCYMHNFPGEHNRGTIAILKKPIIVYASEPREEPSKENRPSLASLPSLRF